MITRNKKIAVIGGGMSGISSAILLAEEGFFVEIFERQDAPAKKILLSGNGRCNLSNKSITLSDYRCASPKKLEKILNSLPDKRRDAFFQKLGLYLCEFRDGIYPVSRQAANVRDALLYRLDELGVKIRNNCYITGIDPARHLILRDGSLTEAYDIICISTGGKAGVYGEEGENGKRVLGSIGHRMEHTHPALTHILCEEDLSPAAGVRCDAGITLLIGKESFSSRGELQITKEALSGIPVFQLSRYLDPDKGASLFVDFLPFTEEDPAWFFERAKCMHERSPEAFLCGLMQKKLALWLLKRNAYDKIKTIRELSEEGQLGLLQKLRKQQFKIRGLGKYRDAQLMSGGVSLEELTEDLESANSPDIYLLGELLDVSGACGGYNLHFSLACAFHVHDAILEKTL